MDTFINASKTLAYHLRHSNLPDKDGWVPVELLIDDFGFSRDLLEEIVTHDNKNRYEFSEDHLSVRARQGHSIKVNPGLVKGTPPHELFHGTSKDRIDSILKEGLKPMAREYVHLSLTAEAAVEVGKRHGSPITLRIDAWKMVNDGVEFLISSNGIWLTKHIKPEYIEFI